MSADAIFVGYWIFGFLMLAYLCREVNGGDKPKFVRLPGKNCQSIGGKLWTTTTSKRAEHRSQEERMKQRSYRIMRLWFGRCASALYRR